MRGRFADAHEAGFGKPERYFYETNPFSEFCL